MGRGRDARLYAGPWPVVAHPPCNKWSPLAYINRRRLPDYEIGDDGGCFEAALNAVRTYGGVLEHPAESLAWRQFNLPRPVQHGPHRRKGRSVTGWVIVGHELPDDVDEQDLAAMGEDDLGKLDDRVAISRLFPTRKEAEQAAAVYWPDGQILEWSGQ